MKPKNFTEWVKFFNRKINGKPSTHFYIGNIQELYYNKDRGFSVIAVSGGKCRVKVTCGDGSYWEEFTENLAAKNGIKQIEFLIIRDIDIFLKAYHWEIISRNENEIVCRDTKGQKVVLHKTIRPNGKQAYEAVKYLKEVQ